MLADILSSLKLRRFSLLHLFPHHFSRPGGFCDNPLRSFEVFTALEVAPLGVSVLPLHASLSACNRDMSLSCSSVRAVEQEHSQSYHRSPDGSTSDQGFNGTTFSERSFVHNFKYFQKYKYFAIHLLPEGRSFLAYVFVNRDFQCQLFASRIENRW